MGIVSHFAHGRVPPTLTSGPSYLPSQPRITQGAAVAEGWILGLAGIVVLVRLGAAGWVWRERQEPRAVLAAFGRNERAVKQQDLGALRIHGNACPVARHRGTAGCEPCRLGQQADERRSLGSPAFKDQ